MKPKPKGVLVEASEFTALDLLVTFLPDADEETNPYGDGEILLKSLDDLRKHRAAVTDPERETRIAISWDTPEEIARLKRSTNPTDAVDAHSPVGRRVVYMLLAKDKGSKDYWGGYLGTRRDMQRQGFATAAWKVAKAALAAVGAGLRQGPPHERTAAGAAWGRSLGESKVVTERKLPGGNVEVRQTVPQLASSIRWGLARLIKTTEYYVRSNYAPDDSTWVKMWIDAMKTQLSDAMSELRDLERNPTTGTRFVERLYDVAQRATRWWHWFNDTQDAFFEDHDWSTLLSTLQGIEKLLVPLVAAAKDHYPLRVKGPGGSVVVSMDPVVVDRSRMVRFAEQLEGVRRTLARSGVDDLLRGRQFFIAEDRVPCVVKGPAVAGVYLQKVQGNAPCVSFDATTPRATYRQGDVMVHTGWPHVMDNVIHELGHAFFYEKMTEGQRARWAEYFALASGHVSGYAASKASEDFAETWAFVLLKRRGTKNYTWDRDAVERFRAFVRSGSMPGFEEVRESVARPAGVLVEAAKGPDDLPDDTTIRIEGQAGTVVVKYLDTITRGASSRRSSARGEIAVNSVAAGGREKTYGECSGAFVVGGSYAKEGWGPLLYDLAMECATILGNGLTPDRLSVSQDALGVWRHYLKSRSDVTVKQLDMYTDTDQGTRDFGRRRGIELMHDAPKLTPNDPSDDCLQFVAQAYHGDDDWAASATAKVYSKKPTMLKRLAKLGKLEVAPYVDRRIKAAAGLRESVEIVEAAGTPAKIPEDTKVFVFADREKIKVSYGAEAPNRPSGSAMGGSLKGRCYAVSSDYTEYGDCLDAYIVQGANARPSGWGPLLYDVAMECATLMGGGLTADRQIVSDEAFLVWNYYLGRRRDVKAKQLDADLSYYEWHTGRDGEEPQDTIDTPKLTPSDKSDDCMALSAVRHSDPWNWASSPLMKVYTKKPSRLRDLKARGKLVIVRGTDARINAAASGR